MQFSALQRARFRNEPEDMQKKYTQRHFARGKEGSILPPKSELGIMKYTKTIKGNLFSVSVAGHCKMFRLQDCCAEGHFF